MDRSGRPYRRTLKSDDTPVDPAWLSGATDSTGRHRRSGEDTVDEFMNDLRYLRVTSGTSFGDIARRSDLARSTAHAMVRPGAPFPGRPEQVEQFVIGCGESQDIAEAWVRRWRRLRAQTWQAQPRKPRTQVTISRPNPLSPLEVTPVPPTKDDAAKPAQPPPLPEVIGQLASEPPVPRIIRRLVRRLVALVMYTLFVVALTIAMTVMLLHGS